MKKLFILLIVLFATSSIYAQFSIGPKVGYTASKFSTDFSDIKESARNNFQVGAFLRFGKKLYLQPEVYYATSGGTFTVSISGTDYQEEIKMKNLGIPILIGYKIINAKIFNLRVLAGPSANFILDTKVEFDEFYQDPIGEDNLDKIAWGMDVGAGVDILFLTLDLRYEIGLNNIYNPLDGGQTQTIKSNAFIVSLGFKLL